MPTRINDKLISWASEVDPETAALTPGPRETMRPRDRMLLAGARRAPGLMRALGRASRRRQLARDHGGTTAS